MKTIEVVIKITERCNIDCSYCYVFNKADQSYKEHPALISIDTVTQLARFLEDAVSKHSIDRVMIDFHGGEPLLIGKRRFSNICNIFMERLAPYCQVQFNLQTNAMLIDNEWISLLSHYQVQVGVSLDGPEEINDLERVDHRGKGTYQRAIAGLRQLSAAYDEGAIPHVGILCVANPNLDAARIFDHFVYDLKLTQFDFLLPIESHDDFQSNSLGGYINFFNAVFKKATEKCHQDVSIRIINNSIGPLISGNKYVIGARSARAGDHLIVTVSSNGDIGPDDSLRCLEGNLFNELNVYRNTYDDLLASPLYKMIFLAEDSIPDDCRSCAWKQVCRGGAANGRLINRYRSGSGFNNRSISCEVLDDLFSEAAAYLLKNGLGYDTLEENLLGEHMIWGAYTQDQIANEEKVIGRSLKRIDALEI